MAFVNATRTGPNDLKIAVGVYGLIARISALGARYSDYRSFRQTVNELSGLSDRDLADLGLNRSAIHATAMEAVYGAQ